MLIKKKGRKGRSRKVTVSFIRALKDIRVNIDLEINDLYELCIITYYDDG